MAFLDELAKKTQDVAAVAGEKVKVAYEVVSEKAKTAAEIAKINLTIAGEQREIIKNYKVIGEWFTSEYEGELPEAIADVVQAVKESKAKIAELEASKPPKEVAVEEECEEAGKACSVCGTVADSKFCPQCGAPMDE
ncbi:MAG: zinc ribbon domain-containing protein [Oscillospiraceae bacterium]|nr:zinc ribbon domain-containing protein [Oscillospiraceae bacterium]